MSEESVQLDILSVNLEEHPNLKTLANLTTAAFNILEPWCVQSKLESAALKGIVTQSKAYAEAINFSILAAKCSHTLAQEAIHFAEKRLNSRPWISHLDQLLYLQGMVAVAREGKANSEKVSHKFMNVGSTVMELIRQAKAELKSLDNHTEACLYSTSQSNELIIQYRTSRAVVAELEGLEKGIPDLKKFLECILLYVAWWSDIHVVQDAMDRSSELNLQQGYAPSRLLFLKESWQKLRVDYQDYVREITILQTCHPELAPESFSLRGLDQKTLEHLSNICNAEKQLNTSITKIKTWVGWSSDERIAPKVKDYLAALECGKSRSQDGENNANKVITAVQRAISLGSDKKKMIGKAVPIIGKELSESIDVLKKFAEVRKAIQKILLTEKKIDNGGSEDKELELTTHALRKFGDAVRADYSWWSDIVSRLTDFEAIIANEHYTDDQFRVLLAGWNALQTEYQGYRQEILELERRYPSDLEDL